MLLAMTMNGYVILSIVVGTGLGKTILSTFNNKFNVSGNKKDESMKTHEEDQ